MTSFRIPYAYLLLLLAAFIRNTAGLKCYQCFYMAGPGLSEGVTFQKDCQKGKDIPEKWSFECHEAKATCGTTQGTLTLGNVKYTVFTRGCFPKNLVNSDGKCHPDSLGPHFNSITSALTKGNRTAYQGMDGGTGSINTCYCDDKDNCNGAISLIPSAPFLLPFLTLLSIYKVSLSLILTN